MSESTHAHPNAGQQRMRWSCIHEVVKCAACIGAAANQSCVIQCWQLLSFISLKVVRAQVKWSPEAFQDRPQPVGHRVVVHDIPPQIDVPSIPQTLTARQHFVPYTYYTCTHTTPLNMSSGSWIAQATFPTQWQLCIYMCSASTYRIAGLESHRAICSLHASYNKYADTYMLDPI